MKAFAFIVCTLFLVHNSLAQCYVRLDDASGFNTDAYQADLQAAAAKLCAIFDTTGFAGQFKVYDFGFYLHQENTTGGYPEPFAQKIQEVQALSPYYLLFGKQTDKSGVYTRFWVDLVLPDSAVFSCLTDFDRINLSFYCENNLILLSNKNSASPQFYYKSEIELIDSLQSGFKKLIDCCYSKRSLIVEDCFPTTCYSKDEIKNILEKKGFRKLAIEVLGPLSAFFQISESKSNNIFSIVDSAMLQIKLNGEMVNLREDFQTISTFSDFNFKCFITKNENICPGSYFSQVNNDFSNQGIYSTKIWFHIFEDEDEDFLYIKWVNYEAPQVDPWGFGFLFHFQDNLFVEPKLPEETDDNRIVNLNSNGFILSISPPKDYGIQNGFLPVKIITANNEQIFTNDGLFDDGLIWNYFNEIYVKPISSITDPREIETISENGWYINCHNTPPINCRLYCDNYPFFFNYSSGVINNLYSDAGIVFMSDLIKRTAFVGIHSKFCGKMDYWCHYFSGAYKLPNSADPLPCPHQYYLMKKEILSPFFRFGNMKIAYNMKDFGNFVWGGAMKRLGFTKEQALAAAQANEDYTDSKADQRAIGSGFDNIPSN